MEIEIIHCQECGKVLNEEPELNHSGVWLKCPEHNEAANNPHTLMLYDPETKELS